MKIECVLDEHDIIDVIRNNIKKTCPERVEEGSIKIELSKTDDD